MILIVQKVHDKFVSSTKAKQVNGLSVCVDMIAKISNKFKIINCTSHEKVYEEIKMSKPKSVIFEAMSFSYITLLEVKRMFPEVNIFLHIHSKFPFLGTENNSITHIQKCIENGIQIIFNHRDGLRAFSNKNCHYIPNYYEVSVLGNIEKNKDHSVINVGCHGSLRHFKNQIVQVSAACILAKQLGKKLRFHINSSRDDGERLSILNAIDRLLIINGAELIHTEWLPHKDFIKYIMSNIDIGMQVSLCETFNMVAADYVTAKIPLVVSPEIDWLPKEIMANPTNILDIVAKMKYALEQKDLSNNNLECLVNHNIKAVDDWEAFIEHYS